MNEVFTWVFGEDQEGRKPTQKETSPTFDLRLDPTQNPSKMLNYAKNNSPISTASKSRQAIRPPSVVNSPSRKVDNFDKTTDKKTLAGTSTTNETNTKTSTFLKKNRLGESRPDLSLENHTTELYSRPNSSEKENKIQTVTKQTSINNNIIPKCSQSRGMSNLQKDNKETLKDVYDRRDDGKQVLCDNVQDNENKANQNNNSIETGAKCNKVFDGNVITNSDSEIIIKSENLNGDSSTIRNNDSKFWNGDPLTKNNIKAGDSQEVIPELEKYKKRKNTEEEMTGSTNISNLASNTDNQRKKSVDEIINKLKSLRVDQEQKNSKISNILIDLSKRIKSTNEKVQQGFIDLNESARRSFNKSLQNIKLTHAMELKKKDAEISSLRESLNRANSQLKISDDNCKKDNEKYEGMEKTLNSFLDFMKSLNFFNLDIGTLLMEYHESKHEDGFDKFVMKKHPEVKGLLTTNHETVIGAITKLKDSMSELSKNIGSNTLQFTEDNTHILNKITLFERLLTQKDVQNNQLRELLDKETSTVESLTRDMEQLKGDQSTALDLENIQKKYPLFQPDTYEYLGLERVNHLTMVRMQNIIKDILILLDLPLDLLPKRIPFICITLKYERNLYAYFVNRLYYQLYNTTIDLRQFTQEANRQYHLDHNMDTIKHPLEECLNNLYNDIVTKL